MNLFCLEIGNYLFGLQVVQFKAKWTSHDEFLRVFFLANFLEPVSHLICGKANKVIIKIRCLFKFEFEKGFRLT